MWCCDKFPSGGFFQAYTATKGSHSFLQNAHNYHVTMQTWNNYTLQLQPYFLFKLYFMFKIIFTEQSEL